LPEILTKQYQGDEDGLAMPFGWRNDKFVEVSGEINLLAKPGNRRIILYFSSSGPQQRCQKTLSNRQFKDD
jgi:hypothetical protein